MWGRNKSVQRAGVWGNSARCSRWNNSKLFPRRKFLSRTHTSSRNGYHQEKKKTTPSFLKKHNANYCHNWKVYISRVTVQRKITTSGAAGYLSGSNFWLLLSGKKKKETELHAAIPPSPLPHSSITFTSLLKFLFQVSSLHHLYLTSQVSVLTALFKINLKPSFLKVAFSFFVFLPFLELLLQHMEVPRQGV